MATRNSGLLILSSSENHNITPQLVKYCMYYIYLQAQYSTNTDKPFASIFLLTISTVYLIHRRGYDNNDNDHQGKNALIFFQILSSNSSRKCMEGLYVDKVTLRIKMNECTYLEQERAWPQIHTP